MSLREHTAGNCVKSTLALADAACSEAGVRLTAIRRQVLEIIAASTTPVGAYAIIDALAMASGRKPAPMTVYRALDFLIDHALVHRLASRNAYLACDHSHGNEDTVAFLLCEQCSRVDEIAGSGLTTLLDSEAKKRGFAAERRLIEISGLCRACAVAPNARDG